MKAGQKGRRGEGVLFLLFPKKYSAWKGAINGGTQAAQFRFGPLPPPFRHGRSSRKVKFTIAFTNNIIIIKNNPQVLVLIFREGTFHDRIHV